jgi:hypothetical protein
MEARGGSGGGAEYLREDGLVAVAVFGCVRLILWAMDVGGQRHVADAVEDGAEVGGGGEPESAFAEVGSGDDFGFEEGCGVVRCGEVEALAGLHFSAGSYKGGPLVLGELLGEEDFDAAGGVGRASLGVLTADACGVEARGDDPAVVENEEVAGVEELGEIAEEVVAVLTGVAVEDEHAAGAADGRGRLRDEFFGELEMEIGYAHWFDFSL